MGHERRDRSWLGGGVVVIPIVRINRPRYPDDVVVFEKSGIAVAAHWYTYF